MATTATPPAAGAAGVAGVAGVAGAAAAAGVAGAAGAAGGPWLFSRRVDLAVFLGSAAVALALLPIGAALGVLHTDTPGWMWLVAVVLVDVAHVWSTAFRVYLDRDELARRRALYLGVPALAWAAGVALYAHGPLTFWRVLAYAAVFHFVRQQYGWVALYRARAPHDPAAPGGPRAGWHRALDAAAIYAATCFPLLYWHAHLPRAFTWFLPGDFAVIQAEYLAPLVAAAEPLYWLVLAAYAARSAHGWIARGRGNPGKDIVVATTAACWYIGIVALDSDYAFTVTNVIIHGVPYFALVYWYAARRHRAGHGGAGLRVLRHGPWLYLAVLWVVAFGEELLWDRGVWHDRAWLFGAGWDLAAVHVLLVPLLAVPQATHYILDGFIWRRRRNPAFARAVALDPGGEPPGG